MVGSPKSSVRDEGCSCPGSNQYSTVESTTNGAVFLFFLHNKWIPCRAMKQLFLFYFGQCPPVALSMANLKRELVISNPAAVKKLVRTCADRYLTAETLVLLVHFPGSSWNRTETRHHNTVSIPVNVAGCVPSSLKGVFGKLIFEGSTTLLIKACNCRMPMARLQ